MKAIILVILLFSAREIERISCEVPKQRTKYEPEIEPDADDVVVKPIWNHLPDYPPHMWPKEVEEEYSCEAIIPKKQPTTDPPKTLEQKIYYPPSFIDTSEEDPNDDFPSVVAKPLVPGLPDLPPHMQPKAENNISSVEPNHPKVVSVKPCEPETSSPKSESPEPLPPGAIARDTITSPEDTEIVTNSTSNSEVNISSGKISAFPAENATNIITENKDNIKNIKPTEYNDNTENKTETQEASTLKSTEEKGRKDNEVEDGIKNIEVQDTTKPKPTEENRNNNDTDGKNVENSESKNNSKNTEKRTEIQETTTQKATQNNDSNIVENNAESSDSKNANENGNNTVGKEIKNEKHETTTPQASQENDNKKNVNKDGKSDSKTPKGNNSNVENTEQTTQTQETTTLKNTQEKFDNKDGQKMTNENTTSKPAEGKDNNVGKQEKYRSQDTSTQSSKQTDANDSSKRDNTKPSNTDNGEQESKADNGLDPFNGQLPPPSGGDGGNIIGTVLKTGGGIITGGVIGGGIVGGGTIISAGKGIVDGGLAIGGTIMSGGGGGGSGGGGQPSIPQSGEGPLNPNSNGETPSNNGEVRNKPNQQKTNNDNNKKDPNKKKQEKDKKKQEKDKKKDDDDIDLDLDELDEDLFMDYDQYSVKQHTKENISAIFVEKMQRLDNTCDWFINNFTNEVNNLTIFRDKYDGMMAYAAQQPKRLGDKLETETDDEVYNKKIEEFNAAALLETYLSSLRDDISTVSSTFNNFIFYTDQLWNQSYSIKTDIVQEILSATSFSHLIYKDVGKVRLVAQVSKLRLIDCVSSALAAYQNWRIFTKEIFLKAITLERNTYSLLIGKYYNDMKKWIEAGNTVTTFVEDATNRSTEIINKFLNLQEGTAECIYNITTYLYKKRVVLLNHVKGHLIY